MIALLEITYPEGLASVAFLVFKLLSVKNLFTSRKGKGKH